MAQQSDVPVSEFEEAYHDKLEIRGAILGQPLGAVPRRPLITVEADTPLAEVIRILNEKHQGCALVVRDGRLAGIFTERDVLVRVVGRPLDLERTPVEKVMTANPDTLPESASIAFALRKMSQEGYRHVPLVDDEKRPVGVVAVRDIVAWMVELFPATVYNLPPEPGYPREADGG